MRHSNPLNALIRPKEEPEIRYQWAVVVSTDPLQVQIETEDDPLPGKVSTLVGNLAVGDRVYLQHYRRRATIMGRAGG